MLRFLFIDQILVIVRTESDCPMNV